MQASTFLEDKINQAGEGEEVVLLDMYLEERSDLCFVPEVDQERVLSIFEESKRFCSQLEDIIQRIPEERVVVERLEQLRGTLLPLLILTVQDGSFYYTIDDDKYVAEISKSSALRVLEHAFQMEDYQE